MFNYLYFHYSTVIPFISMHLKKLDFMWLFHEVENNFSSKVDNLNSTDNGESSEKSHGASNCRQHVHKLCSSIFCDSVKCRSVKVYPHKSQLVFPLVTWTYIYNQFTYLYCGIKVPFMGELVFGLNLFLYFL